MEKLVIKYRYLERVDVSPGIPDKLAHDTAKDFILRRDRSKRKATPKDMLQAAAGSLIGVAIPMFFMMKKQKVKNPFKLEYGLKEMMVMSATPIMGGVAVGMIGNDAETNYGKSREGVFQFLNAAIPTWLSGASLRLCETSKSLNNIPAKIISLAVALLTGMHGAAVLSNQICDPKDRYLDRKLTMRDSFANLDDMIGVFVLAKFPLVNKLRIEKLLPLIYSYCGFRVGKSN